MVADGKSEVQPNRCDFGQRHLPIHEDSSCPFAPRRMDSDGFFRSTSVNPSSDNGVRSCRFVGAPPTCCKSLQGHYGRAEQLKGNAVAPRLPQRHAAPFQKADDRFPRRFGFARRPHFYDKDSVCRFPVLRPSSPIPFRKGVDGVVSVVSALASDDNKLQNALAFRWQLKRLRIWTDDSPTVNDGQPHSPFQGLCTCIGQMNANRDWGLQLGDELRGVNPQGHIANFCDGRVKSGCDSAHHRHS